ncbi:TPA: hypothetical protein RNS57_002441 [Stenotrophomonas maltophilia]|uniref:ApeA N-terminal domain 1-containing protein n=1 Tax=Stenotrophomonas maltophilia TaxID=40324 RepID=UPI001181663C|nr:HEPN domain-containing protein [Stenotrophomonas maltophilia]HDX0794173.1 hypothetical protein [Stenotrophomonas maltophilia]HDX0798377.1 hypothetical protein [Stenotrophomonas maltophilia]HDX0941010.1 hypothetical protein [Stenotrophomonas maltophilia]
MSKINSDLLLEHEWPCAVHPPGQPQLAFPGTLRYSPTGGLTLEYACPFNPEYDKEVGRLYGATASGDAFTLVGKFSTERAGFKARSSSAYQTGKHSFKYAIFGHHVDAECKFSSFEFDICGLKDFLTDSDYSALATFGSRDLFDIDTPAGKIRGVQSMNTTLLSRRLSDQIHCFEKDIAAMSKLQEAYDSIRLEHPDFTPMVKAKSEYRIILEREDGADVEEAYPTCHAIADLFSVLFFGPAPLRTLTAQVIDQAGKTHSWEVFPSKVSEAGSIKRATEPKSHFHIPVNSWDIDLGQTIKNWLPVETDFRTLICTLQGATTLTSYSEILSRIVLCAAQLEGISKKAGRNKDAEKYQYAIDSYASPPLIDRLCNLLHRGQTELGKSIGDLRNDIAHIGRKSKIAHMLSTREKYAVCIALEATIIGYVLTTVGVDRQAVEKHQRTLLRFVEG